MPLLWFLLFASYAFASPIVKTDSVFAYMYGGDSLFLKYQFKIPSEPYTTKTGILVYFHGNSTATQDQVLANGMGWAEYYANKHNLIPVVFASPYASPAGVRAWGYEEDTKIVHALLKGNLKSQLNIDQERVYLWGGSQGSCFINAFLTLVGTEYGGGSYIMCGCLDYFNNDWNPSTTFKENYRVFVQANTGDFLWEPSRDAEEYYRLNAEVKNTRSLLTREGNHCEYSNGMNDSILEWVIDEKDELFADEIPFEPYWDRLQVFSGDLRAVTMDPNNHILVISENSNGENEVYKSIDLGKSWDYASQIIGADSITDMTVFKDEIWVSSSNGLWKSTDGVQFAQFDALETNELWSNNNQLYRMGWTTGLREYANDAWVSLNYGSGSILGAHHDFARVEANRKLWFWAYKTAKYRVFTRDSLGMVSEKTIHATGVNYLYGDQRGSTAVVFGYFNDGSTKLLVSNDFGETWVDRIATSPYKNLYAGIEVAILPSGQIILYGGRSAVVSGDLGLTWERMPNFRLQFYAQLTQNKQGDLFSIAGKSIYQWKTKPSISTNLVYESKNGLKLRQNNLFALRNRAIEVYASTSWSLQIFDLQGKIAWTTAGNGPQTLRPSLVSGVYFVEFAEKGKKNAKTVTSWRLP